VDKYTWQHIGSSFLPSELTAAFLWAQMEEAEELTRRRRETWEHYHMAFEPLEKSGLLTRPVVPPGCRHNAHMYYIIVPDLETRERLLFRLKEQGINAIFHYVPLHSSPAGGKYGRAHGELRVTQSLSDRIVRLPMWVGLSMGHVERIVSSVKHILTDTS
jgi:dTDP-4-amino-4,6-dideoxygalactose transaminase